MANIPCKALGSDMDPIITNVKEHKDYCTYIHGNNCDNKEFLN